MYRLKDVRGWTNEQLMQAMRNLTPGLKLTQSNVGQYMSGYEMGEGHQAAIRMLEQQYLNQSNGLNKLPELGFFPLERIEPGPASITRLLDWGAILPSTLAIALGVDASAIPYLQLRVTHPEHQSMSLDQKRLLRKVLEEARQASRTIVNATPPPTPSEPEAEEVYSVPYGEHPPWDRLKPASVIASPDILRKIDSLSAMLAQSDARVAALQKLLSAIKGDRAADRFLYTFLGTLVGAAATIFTRHFFF
tara:strand:+ start:505 stop:1251 length:747 start_codon:yes stop_codon:yes gene_type:complete